MHLIPKKWSLRLGNRGVSPIFSTVLLAAIIVVVGTTAFYFSTNLTTNATNQYTDSASDSKQTISERISFERVQYNPIARTITFYLLNCGVANNLQIDNVLLYDSSHNIVAVYSGSSISSLSNLNSGNLLPNNALNVGQEGYFTVSLGNDGAGNPVVLASDLIYTLQVVTKSGSSFDYALSVSLS